MSNVILCNLSDANTIIEEERLYWVFDVLECVGIPEEVYDVASIDEYREKMDVYGVDVELITNGEVYIYKKEWYEGPNEEESGWLSPTKDHLIGHWKEPIRIMKMDDKGIHYEIHLNEWSILNTRRKV